MSDDKNENHELDELRNLLAPLTKLQPNEAQMRQWREALGHEMQQEKHPRLSVRPKLRRRSLTRLGEWVVAAAVGFSLAVAWGHLQEREDQPSPIYADIDATQMRLVANQD